MLEILKRFVSRDEARPGLLAPWTQAGFSYATDGRVMVRVPAVVGLADREELVALVRRPPCGESVVGPALQKVVVWVPFVMQPEERRHRCGACDGSGLTDERDCVECRGTGDVECRHCGVESPCKVCDGSGKVVEPGLGEFCDVCFGSGRVPELLLTPMGYLAGNLQVMLEVLPELELGVYESNGRQVIPFRFAGGEGVVMPMRRDDVACDSLNKQVLARAVGAAH